MAPSGTMLLDGPRRIWTTTRLSKTSRSRISLSGTSTTHHYPMVLPTFVPDRAGSSRNRLSWETAARVHAQGEWRSSTTIAPLPLP
eukprot:3377557-Pyramimonas_sp.AAC.1